MAQKDNIKIIVIIALVVTLLFLSVGNKGGDASISVGDKISNFLGAQSASSQNSGTDPDTDFLSLRMYDRNGQLINQGQTFSIVNNVPGVYYIDLTVTAINTGSVALSCSLPSRSPSAFSLALQDSTKTVPVGGRASWTSSQISVQQFESTIPTTFSATVRCTGNSITLPDKMGSLSVLIQPEAGADFTVTIDTGGTPTEFCGDNICQVSEDSTSCPGDCVVANNVKFRTSDLSYVSGSAIGYTSSCGSTLTRYGHSSTSGTLSGDCNALTTLSSYCGTSPIKLFTIPGTGTALFKPTELDRLCVCKNGASGNYNIIKYNTGDSDSVNVDSVPVSFDSAKEVACT